jgi:ABC-2 type transport system ATP-binding protein
MLGNPEILVLDEPTNGLDPEGFAEVRELILQEARNGKTIILASHILDEVEKVCSHVAVLKEGRSIAIGRVHELLAGDDVVRVTTDKPDALQELLVREGWTKSIKKENGDLVITLVQDKSPRDLNAFAFEKGFVLDRIQVTKHSLESQFLELVRNKQ